MWVVVGVGDSCSHEWRWVGCFARTSVGARWRELIHSRQQRRRRREGPGRRASRVGGGKRFTTYDRGRGRGRGRECVGEKRASGGDGLRVMGKEKEVSVNEEARCFF